MPASRSVAMSAVDLPPCAEVRRAIGGLPDRIDAVASERHSSDRKASTGHPADARLNGRSA